MSYIRHLIHNNLFFFIITINDIKCKRFGKKNSNLSVIFSLNLLYYSLLFKSINSQKIHNYFDNIFTNIHYLNCIFSKALLLFQTLQMYHLFLFLLPLLGNFLKVPTYSRSKTSYYAMVFYCNYSFCLFCTLYYHFFV